MAPDTDKSQKNNLLNEFVVNLMDEIILHTKDKTFVALQSIAIIGII